GVAGIWATALSVSSRSITRRGGFAKSLAWYLAAPEVLTWIVVTLVESTVTSLTCTRRGAPGCACTGGGGPGCGCTGGGVPGCPCTGGGVPGGPCTGGGVPGCACTGGAVPGCPCAAPETTTRARSDPRIRPVHAIECPLLKVISLFSAEASGASAARPGAGPR